MSVQSEIDRISGNVQDTISTIRQTGVTVPSGANSDNLPSLAAALANEKQDKLTGAEGQIVGFDSSGNAVAQDAPSAGITQEQADNRYVSLTQKGAANGVASLGSDGKVPAGQLPEMDYDPAGSAAAVQTNLTSHINDKNNPHGVTAAQVGAYTEAEVLSSTTKTKYGLGSSAVPDDAFDKLGQSILLKKTKAGELSVGSIVQLNVDGTLTDFIVVNQGIPGNSNLYDESCNGTWLLMKDCYESRQWHSSNSNSYKASTIHTYLNGTFLNLFDADIREVIKQVKIPYVNGTGNSAVASGSSGLSCKIFLLSGREVGFSTSDNQYFPNDGAKLSYFESGTGSSALNKRIAKLNGSATRWWLRSPYAYNASSAWLVYSNGSYGNFSCSSSYGIRPALVLPSDFEVDVIGGLTDIQGNDITDAVSNALGIPGLFTSVSEGKSLIAAAVTDKGVETAADATFQQMAENISAIETGTTLEMVTITFQYTIPAVFVNSVNVYYIDADSLQISSKKVPTSESMGIVEFLTIKNFPLMFVYGTGDIDSAVAANITLNSGDAERIGSSNVWVVKSDCDFYT